MKTKTVKKGTYLYLTEENFQVLVKNCLKFGGTKSRTMNILLDAFRTGKKPKFEKYMPTAIQKALNTASRREKTLKKELTTTAKQA